jgi:hypothetical protein
MAQVASRTQRLVHALTQPPGLRDVLTTMGGIDRRRRIPLFAGQTLQVWSARRDPGLSGRRGEVVLWPDTFTNHLAPRSDRRRSRYWRRRAGGSRCPASRCVEV